MQEISLSNIPNQEFSVNLNNVQYTIKINTHEDRTLMTISTEDEKLIDGIRVYGGQKVIPYKYKTRGGNFIWTGDYYPHYTNFNKTSFLSFRGDNE